MLERQKRSDVASFGCLAIFFGIIPGFLLGKFGGWLTGFASSETVVYGRVAGWVVGLGIFIGALWKFIPYERRERKRGRQDARDQVVQEIAVSQPRVFEISAVNEHEPILAFDIGDERILLLQGQWLREPGTYGAPHEEDDPEEAFLNGLPKPFSFPSSAFRVTRLPHSGRVLSIRVEGEYLAPEKQVDALRGEYDFADSALLDGSLDDISRVLARAYAKRSDT